MAKSSDFAIIADELAAIRGELAELRSRLDTPSHRVQIQTRARDIEIPDPVPLEIPGGKRDTGDTIQEIIARYVQLEHAKLQDDDLGTFEQEDDFTEDDFDALPASLFEVSDVALEADPDMPPAEDASDLEDDPSTGHIPPAEPPVDAPAATEDSRPA